MNKQQLSLSELLRPLADGGIARGHVQLSVVSSKLLDEMTLVLNEGFRKNVGFYAKCLFDIRKPLKQRIAVLMRLAKSWTISIRSLKEIDTCVQECDLISIVSVFWTPGINYCSAIVTFRDITILYRPVF